VRFSISALRYLSYASVACTVLFEFDDDVLSGRPSSDGTCTWRRCSNTTVLHLAPTLLLTNLG
jgi:hypothetical protein